MKLKHILPSIVAGLSGLASSSIVLIKEGYLQTVIIVTLIIGLCVVMGMLISRSQISR